MPDTGHCAPDHVDPRDYGLISDGLSHALSTRYASLAGAQADYPFATSLTQEIDYCAVKAASNVAFGSDGSEHGTNAHLNRRLYLPAGAYLFGNDTWIIRNLASGVIEGDGKLATVIRGNKTLLAFDGIWYSRISDLSLQCQATDAVAAMELDGNVPGHPYITRGVQGITLRDLLIDGGGSTYTLSMCRQGGSGAQGSECVYINCHLQSASFACYYQNGFNALANTFLGGNFQNYQKHGAYIIGGTFAFINTGFQGTQGYKQIENDGWDIQCGDAGAYESCVVYGCRTESMRFLRNTGAVRVDVRGCVGQPAVQGWFASTPYGAAAPLYKAILEGGRMFVAMTEGTSDLSKPDFTGVVSGGTIADGTVVWRETPFTAISNLYGSVDLGTTEMRGGGLVQLPDYSSALVSVNSHYTVSLPIDTVICDCTSSAITVTIPDIHTIGGNRGRRVTIAKCDMSANPVNIFLAGGYAGGGQTYTLAGGARRAATFVWADGVAGQRSWHVIG